MKIFDQLREEHVVIERVVGALQTFAAARLRGAGEAGDGRGFLEFFRVFADRHHHALEEGVLFPAIAKAIEVSSDKGPLAALLGDHRSMRVLVEELAPYLRGDAEGVARLAGLAARHGEALLHHIDAENHVLFDECERRLPRAGVLELPTRPAGPEELAARAEGERLAVVYPPSEIPGILRGEGCVACPNYGTSCEGIEREWWSELEWEDASERLGS
jgi:hemerythrin-like domain-containing protein